MEYHSSVLKDYRLNEKQWIIARVFAKPIKVSIVNKYKINVIYSCEKQKITAYTHKQMAIFALIDSSVTLTDGAMAISVFTIHILWL